MEERRRSPRVVPTRTAALKLTVRRPVQVLELSAGGGLLSATALASAEPVSGELHMTLGNAPFAAQVHLSRVARDPGDGRVLLGAAFDALSPDGQRALDDVLGRSSH